MGRPSASVRISAASGIVRTLPARSISRRFKAEAPVNARALHAEDAPRSGQCMAKRRLVIEIALDDFDALARQRRGPLAVRLARQATQMETGAIQCLRHRSALLACHSGDENRSIFCHGL